MNDSNLGNRVGTRIARPRIDTSHLSKHTEHFRDFIAAVRELIWNSVDAKAREIIIRFVRRDTHTDLMITDDGEGMNQDGLDAIVSLDFSPSAADPEKRGRMGNGSKGFVHHARGLRVETRQAGDSVLSVITYTPTQLIAMWNNGSASWDTFNPPANHPIRVSGTVVTLLELGSGDGVNPKHDRSPKRLVEELAGRMPMHVARRVTVIDEQGRSHHLKSRRLMGEKIEGEGTIPGLGSVSYELGILPDPDANVDRLEMWALEPVCDIHVFFSSVRLTPALATLLRPVRQMLDHPQVAGSIVIPGLKSLVGQDRLSFRQDLYDDEEMIFRIVKFLHDVLLPRVTAVLGQDTAKRMTSTDAETLRQEIVRLMQNVGSAPQSRTPVVDVDLLRVAPSVVSLEPGEQVSLEVVDPKPGISYTWDDQSSGGTLSKKTGLNVTFTAGKAVGDFRLRVMDSEANEKTIGVNIVSELPFGFSQRVRTVLPRQRITLKLINTRRTTGQFTWDGSECGGSLEIAQDGLSAIYEAGEAEAEYQVTVTELSAPDTRLPKSTKCFLSVRRKSNEEDKRNPSSFVFLWTDGTPFELRLVPYFSTEVEGVTSSFHLGAARTRPNIITVNSGHPSFEGQPIDVQRMMVVRELSLRIAQFELRDELALANTVNLVDTLSVRAGTILRTILMKRKKV
ncbi:hypothetical protein EPN81_03600 [Patescibacteria group bacterium]|nr:MAG: hypothetical protein EPN81_03600 [Patescibacteria group bacterium]